MTEAVQKTIELITTLTSQFNLKVVRNAAIGGGLHIVNLRNDSDTLDISIEWCDDRVEAIEAICMNDSGCVNDTERYLFWDRFHYNQPAKVFNIDEVCKELQEYIEDHKDLL